MKSHNNSMLLVFKTDSFQTARSWKIPFRQSLGASARMWWLSDRSNNIFAFPDSDSNGIYDKNLNCVWIIILPVNKLIHLTFNTFPLEAASTRQRCLYDHVKNSAVSGEEQSGLQSPGEAWARPC
ncbi:cubilin-like [Macaca nemestrina]|uniref:cubilin-like n=1 Tax=Macaca nemestrina TaxID=9545 RepID=UPI0039B929CA